MSDLFLQLEKQIAQDFLDKKTDAIYDCSEIYSLIEHKDREMEERDRQILRLNHDYNESTDEYKKEIEELKKGFDWRTLKDERDQELEDCKLQIEDLKRELEFVKKLHDLAIGELGELASVEHEARLKGSLIEILVKVIHRLEEE